LNIVVRKTSIGKAVNGCSSSRILPNREVNKTTPTFDQAYLPPQPTNGNINDYTMFLVLFRRENMLELAKSHPDPDPIFTLQDSE
jgi:hypothetical protein